MARIMDRIISIDPGRRVARMIRARIDLERRADTGPLRALIEKILTNEPGSEKDPFVAEHRMDVALYDRDLDTAASLASAVQEKDGRDFLLGKVATLKGDAAGAHAAFTKARAQAEEEVRAHPDDMDLLFSLAQIDALLGRKQEALSEGRRAMELVPEAPEVMFGPNPTEAGARTSFALLCARAGERETALEQLEALAKVPGGPSYGNLRLDPMWDLLRGDPRFEKIVASLAPKETVSK
jgi:hypothetical protein